MLTQYKIEHDATFHQQLYPGVTREIDDLKESLFDIKSAQKTAIVISLLKNHSIKAEWLDGNRRLTRLLTSGALATSHLESLFSSCRGNAGFLAGLENYIETQLA